jgi:hypothetical protein
MLERFIAPREESVFTEWVRRPRPKVLRLVLMELSSLESYLSLFSSFLHGVLIPFVVFHSMLSSALGPNGIVLVIAMPELGNRITK